MLDLGCGPGALMHLLWELGVDVEGIDFAESSKELATPETRDRITVGQVTDPALKPDHSYDLVISREVLEHLTVLQVKQAVANMVRLTSRFIYVTTRFHPDPESLLDFTTQFDVDPSHITLAEQGHAAADVHPRGMPVPARSRGAHGLGQQGPCPRAGEAEDVGSRR